jgi:peptidoglycan/xylan/chitin deacetylase (PgdA/CDA1 family)
MYHYVRPFNAEYKYFNSLDVDIFRQQLNYFEKKYGFISKEEYIDAIRTKKNIDGAVLTFDDGLKDHFTYVLPELNKRGLWGLFYVSSGVYDENKILGVHRVHLLKGKYGANEILKETLNYIDNSMLDHKTIEEFDKEIYKAPSYELNEIKLKRIFNYYLNYEYRDIILSKLMNKFFDEDKLFHQLYLSKNEIKELVHNGNIVGSHTVSHKVLSRLSYEEQFIELNESFNFLESLVKLEYKSFCYPYGYRSSYNDNTLKILKELNIDDAVVFDNNIQNNNIMKYELSRIDCNKFMEV